MRSASISNSQQTRTIPLERVDLVLRSSDTTSSSSDLSLTLIYLFMSLADPYLPL